MATRTSIKNKNKAKLGAVASLAAGGVVFGVDAGTVDPQGANGSALLESAFRLLEEGQNLFMDEDDSQAPGNNRVKLEINPVAAGGNGGELNVSFVDAQAAAPDVFMAQAQSSDIVMAQAQSGDIVLAQAQSSDIMLAQAETSAAGGAGAGGAGAGTAGGVAAGTQAAGLVAAGPLATAVATGVATAIGVATIDSINSSSGSDLNDDQDASALTSSAQLLSLSGSSDNNLDSSGPSVNAGLIGGSSFIDDSTNSFFS